MISTYEDYKTMPGSLHTNLSLFYFPILNGIILYRKWVKKWLYILTI